MADERDGPDTLRVPFIFVKHGDKEPREWMARHPGWVKFPAVMIPRNSPHHPANGGRYPTFDAPPPPPRPPVESVPDSEAWPLGKPISATLRGTMSRLRTGGRPSPYPGGEGAPPGTGDPIGAFLRANDALDPRKLRQRAGPSAPDRPPHSA